MFIQNLNIFDKIEFNRAFDKFWSKVTENHNRKEIIGVLVRVKGNDGSTITLGPLYKIARRIEDREELRVALWLYTSIRANTYNDFIITSVTFQYINLGSHAKREIPIKTPKKVESHSSPPAGLRGGVGKL